MHRSRGNRRQRGTDTPRGMYLLGLVKYEYVSILFIVYECCERVSVGATDDLSGVRYARINLSLSIL